MEKKTYLVTNDFVDKESGEEVKAGATFEADEERAEALRKAGVIGKEVQPVEKPDDPGTPLTVEEFSALSAPEQKARLEKLEIEGDDSNGEKRVALYEAYLKAQAGGEPDAPEGSSAAG